MSKLFLNHPTFTITQDIKQICKPLKELGITYFGHVRLDHENKFSALINNPGFLEHYLQSKYFNVDIHTSDKKQFGQFVIWDAIERKGTSEKMHQEAAQFGIQHTFTIIENDQDGRHFYHFANNSNNLSINQVYLTHLDLLKLFIARFKHQVSQSKSLLHAYDLKFSLDQNAEGYTLKSDFQNALENINRVNFIKHLTKNRHRSPNHFIIFHKDTLKPILLAPQQFKCLSLLMMGNSTKQIAYKMQLSYRTVCHYLDRIRKLLGCRSSKELIANYYTQVQNNI